MATSCGEIRNWLPSLHHARSLVFHFPYHNAGDVSRLELGDGVVEGLLKAIVDPLGDEPVEVNGPA